MSYVYLLFSFCLCPLVFPVSCKCVLMCCAYMYSIILSHLCISTLLSRAVKRKGFGQQMEGSGSGRHDGGVTCAPNCPTTSAGSGGGPSSSSGPGTAGTAEPQRTGSEIRREPSDRQCSASASQVSNMSTHSGIHHSTSSGNGSIKDLPLTQVGACLASLEFCRVFLFMLCWVMLVPCVVLEGGSIDESPL